MQHDKKNHNNVYLVVETQYYKKLYTVNPYNM